MDTDVMSIGVLNCLRNHGIQVPDYIMLASFDNIEQAEYCNPRLTTLNVPIEAMRVKAVELLVAQMENRECKNTGNAFELELIIRETTKNR
ncbi:substrate-binding domain-containing protein [Schaedlerella arabinosiphila]|nr:substrate-binding domain-containing protein [Schaedlerella arabinosiphila]